MPSASWGGGVGERLRAAFDPERRQQQVEQVNKPPVEINYITARDGVTMATGCERLK